MSEPLYKTQRNKRTGAIRQLVSNDDGATWEVQSERSGKPAPNPADIVAEEDGSGGYDPVARQAEADAMSSRVDAGGTPSEADPPSPAVTQRPGYEEPADATTFRRTRGGPEAPLDKGEVTHPLAEFAQSVKGFGPDAARQWWNDQMTPATPPANATPAWNAEQGIAAAGTDKQNLADVTEGVVLGSPWGRAATVPGRIGLAMGQGAFANTASGQIHSDADTMSERLSEIPEDAALGALGGLVFSGGAEATAAAGRRGSEALQELAQKYRRSANLNRIQATNATPTEMAHIADAKGMDNIDALGEDIERLGLHKGEGPLGFLPQKPKTYFENAQKADTRAGEEIGSILEGAGKASIRRTDLASRLEQAADGLEASPRGDAQSTGALLKAIRGEAAHLRERAKMQGPWVSVQELNALKGTYQSEAFNGLRALDSAKAEANRGAGRITKEAMLERLAKPPTKRTPGTGPEKADALKQALRDAEVAKTVQDASQRTAVTGDGRFGFYDALMSMGGAGAGTAAGGPIGGAVGLLAGLAARREVAQRAPAAAAGSYRALQHLAERGARAAGDFADVAQQAPSSAGVASGAMPDSVGFATSMQPAAAQEDATTATRGHESEAAIRSILARSPQQLGPYAGKLQQAASAKDPGELEAEISRLAQTDETFRTQYLPQLQSGAR